MMYAQPMTISLSSHMLKTDRAIIIMHIIHAGRKRQRVYMGIQVASSASPIQNKRLKGNAVAGLLFSDWTTIDR